MTEIDRRRMMLGSAMLCASALAVATRPPIPRSRLSQAALERAVPRAVPGYASIDDATVVLPPQDTLSQLIYDGLIIRSYRTPAGEPLSLVIAYGATQDYALEIHRPETCYPASGFGIGPVGQVILSLGDRRMPANTLLATRGTQREHLLYWTRIGNRFPVTLWQEREAIAAAAIRWQVADGVLVRLSTAAEGGARTLARFVEAWVPLLSPVGQTLMLGGAQR